MGLGTGPSHAGPIGHPAALWQDFWQLAEATWYTYWAGGHPQWGMQSERYKLALFPSTDNFEFYDLREDPREMINQAGNPRCASAIARARKTVPSLMQDVQIVPEQLLGQVVVERRRNPDSQK